MIFIMIHYNYQGRYFSFPSNDTEAIGISKSKLRPRAQYQYPSVGGAQQSSDSQLQTAMLFELPSVLQSLFPYASLHLNSFTASTIQRSVPPQRHKQPNKKL